MAYDTTSIDRIKAEGAIRRQAAIASWDTLPETQRVASVLHDTLCRWDHTEGCAWFYAEKDGWGNESSHIEYEEKALKALEISDADSIVALFLSVSNKRY